MTTGWSLSSTVTMRRSRSSIVVHHGRMVGLWVQHRIKAFWWRLVQETRQSLMEGCQRTVGDYKIHWDDHYAVRKV